MTEFIEVAGGRLAYEVTGSGPLMVLSPGLGDTRSAYRFLAPELVAAGYRVAITDLRGHGESSVNWSSYHRTDTAQDLLALVRHLGGPATLVGASFSGGSAAIAAAQEPDLINAIVQVDPGTRAPKIAFGDLNGRFLKGMTLLAGAMGLRSVPLWMSYLRSSGYNGAKPADFSPALAELAVNLKQPGRMAAAAKMGFASPKDAGHALAQVQCPTLVIMGELDPDFPNPRAEAEGIVADLVSSRDASLQMVPNTGHYPHVQAPETVAAAIIGFLAKVAHA